MPKADNWELFAAVVAFVAGVYYDKQLVGVRCASLTQEGTENEALAPLS